ncbi:uncharacterized protein LOC108650293 [Drosophila navojoa]|uniref:uncharacterized protein LOC108650293 n=1 Tax=Drosophila navojoa TaxID=7232 RepID=UPI000846E784|nr:uncharacterized protein LOC108650293 [Drosophila navojoa]
MRPDFKPMPMSMSKPCRAVATFNCATSLWQTQQGTRTHTYIHIHRPCNYSPIIDVKGRSCAPRPLLSPPSPTPTPPTPSPSPPSPLPLPLPALQL